MAYKFFARKLPMTKIDFKKELKTLYRPSATKVEEVNVPAMNFLLLDGEGDPNTSQAFQDALGALYPISYTLKFFVKRTSGIDYGVMPLEGLWWTDNMTTFSVDRKNEWKWTLMIMQPEPVTGAMVEAAIEEVKKKKNPVALSKIRFEKFAEGRAAQVMHLGPFSDEGPTVEKVHDFIRRRGGSLTGMHHEIYLSDFRRAAPEKWKTVIRQPMA